MHEMVVREGNFNVSNSLPRLLLYRSVWESAVSKATRAAAAERLPTQVQVQGVEQQAGVKPGRLRAPGGWANRVMAPCISSRFDTKTATLVNLCISRNMHSYVIILFSVFISKAVL